MVTHTRIKAYCTSLRFGDTTKSTMPARGIFAPRRIIPIRTQDTRGVWGKVAGAVSGQTLALVNEGGSRHQCFFASRTCLALAVLV